MKTLPTLLLVSLLGTALPGSAQNKPAIEADPFVKNPENAAAPKKADYRPMANCMLVLEVYSLDKNAALALLESGTGSSARYQQTMELAKNGKARLEILTALNSKSGQRGTLESIKEVRYPNGFTASADKSRRATPKNYETRNVGDTLEFVVALSPKGETCQVDLAPEHVGRKMGALGDDFSKPHFSEQKTSTSISFPVNAIHYLGTLTPASDYGAFNDDQETWLAFIRVNVTEPGVDQLKPPVKPLDRSALNLEYSFYSLERAAAREILIGASKIDGPWEALQTLIGEKKARFEHVVSLQGKSGQHTITEEMHEVSYTVQYEDKPAILEPINRASTTQARNDAPKADSKNPTETAPGDRGIMNSGMPEIIEKRNVGLTVDAEPIIAADGLTLSVNHIIGSVMLSTDLKSLVPATGSPTQPMFETRRLATPQTLLTGHKMLIGTFSPTDAGSLNKRADTDRTWLVFVRATPSEP
ncbi:MAG: hypothetical protein JWL90_2211 [Chthoniobacteraceae bacterium]|nr:hypothetical protein [Chthoniobacteraceae bacterium]